MGRIKTALTKRLTHELLEKRSDFTTEFEKNKEIVDKSVELPSKKMRNIIAGYAARLVKNKKEI